MVMDLSISNTNLNFFITEQYYITFKKYEQARHSTGSSVHQGAGLAGGEEPF